MPPPEAQAASENIGVDGDQEIGQARERESRLRLGGPRGQHGKTQLAPAPHRRLPHRRLADPGLADELELGRAGLVSSQEALDHGELGLSPDEAGHSSSLQSLPVAGLRLDEISVRFQTVNRLDVLGVGRFAAGRLVPEPQLV